MAIKEGHANDAIESYILHDGVEGAELSDVGAQVNLRFVREAIGKVRVKDGVVVSRTANSFPVGDGFRAVPVTELGPS